MLLQKEGASGKIPELKFKYRPNNLSLPITTSGESVNVLRKIWDNDLLSIQEQVYVLFLNANNQVICYRCLHTGTTTQTLFDIRLALACALGCLAVKVIIAHNHPSGNPRPSQGDVGITQQLKAACTLMEIHLIDHIILTMYDFYSFKDNRIVF